MERDLPDNARPIGYVTATAIVIASMVGTGVFTTLGLQAQEIQSGFALLCLWALGGLIAMAGALSYSELAAAMPRSGGEYHFLGRIYHPVLGIVAGWVSVTVGFAAPSALAAMALGHYAAAFSDVSPMPVAVITIVAITVFHGFSVRIGKHFHLVATAMKLAERRPGARILLLEKENTLAKHQTGLNSGVIHSGIYYKPGSYKARFARAGAESMVEFYLRGGGPFTDNEDPQLVSLIAQGVPR